MKRPSDTVTALIAQIIDDYQDKYIALEKDMDKLMQVVNLWNRAEMDANIAMSVLKDMATRYQLKREKTTSMVEAVKKAGGYGP